MSRESTLRVETIFGPFPCILDSELLLYAINRALWENESNARTRSTNHSSNWTKLRRRKPEGFEMIVSCLQRLPPKAGSLARESAVTANKVTKVICPMACFPLMKASPCADSLYKRQQPEARSQAWAWRQKYCGMTTSLRSGSSRCWDGRTTTTRTCWTGRTTTSSAQAISTTYVSIIWQSMTSSNFPSTENTQLASPANILLLSNAAHTKLRLLWATPMGLSKFMTTSRRGQSTMDRTTFKELEPSNGLPIRFSLGPKTNFSNVSIRVQKSS